MIKIDNKLTEEYFEIAGHLIQIRIEPPDFIKKRKRISRLIDNQEYADALAEINKLPIDWINDREIVRLAGLAAMSAAMDVSK